MSTFVYNKGISSFEDKDKINLIFGLFFDGTRNNMEHTKIRKKINHKGEFSSEEATAKEKNIYDTYAEADDSFANDFTNIARMFMCCEEDYSIYIEGIGTVEEEREQKKDESDGYIYGRGFTGIVPKVRRGCLKLAERIKNKEKERVEEGKKIKEINLTIDVFGFSRGAAAARYFLYNLQKSSYEHGVLPPTAVTYDKAIIKLDHAGGFVDDSLIENGLLPPFGFLGTSLLRLGVPRELVDNMKVTIRFLGLYDTVVSYDPESLLIPSFKKYIGKLHLDEIGNPIRVVHYTALDEHRKNFSITRLKTETLSNAFEIGFPGVHSDIGGSYNNDRLTEKEIFNLLSKSKLYSKTKDFLKMKDFLKTKGILKMNDILKMKDILKMDDILKMKDILKINDILMYSCDYEIIVLEKSVFESSLEKLRQELIREGWFFEYQITIEGGFPRKTLYSERFLRPRYNLIPMHFMCEDFSNYISNNELIENKMYTNYCLEDDFLENVKEYLRKHTIEGKQEWVLEHPEIPNRYNFYEYIYSNENSKREGEFTFTKSDIELSEIEITAYRADYLLRKLRNCYLHRSAKMNTTTDYLGHGPTSDRIRKEY